MKRNKTPEDFRAHFIKRAHRYDASASWVRDGELISRIFDLAKPEKSSVVLDLAVGTGRIAEAFKGKTAAGMMIPFGWNW